MPVRYEAVDVGDNLTLPCSSEDALPESGVTSGVMWVREGREDAQIARTKVRPDGSLQLLNVSALDAGNYSCTLDDDADAVKTRVNVAIRSEFPRLAIPGA